MAANQYGKVINITSIFASRGTMDLAHYCAAKGGLEALTRALAVEMAPIGVRVNAIAPGLVRTDLTSEIMADEEALARRVEEMPLGGPLEPGDVAGAAVFLASSASDMITGTVIAVDAGAAAH
jgi:NAD(P)-dependent dehydrogenase (short-subunit alcohol dehydrogenase family)